MAVTDYTDPDQAAAACESQIRDMRAGLIALCAARDAARHLAGLTADRDAAKAALDAARTGADKSRKDLDAAVKAEARAAQRTAEAHVAVAKAAAEHASASQRGTVDQETSARDKLTGRRETLASREQAEAHCHGERQAAALRADQAAAEVSRHELEHAGRESAVACPGRAPVSEDTLETVSLWYSAARPPAGLPVLDLEEQRARYGVLWGAARHHTTTPDHEVTAADFADIRLTGSRA